MRAWGFRDAPLLFSFCERNTGKYRRSSHSANSASHRYSYPAYHKAIGRPSSLIQIAEFSESPFYCPLRDPFDGLNVVARGTLAEQFRMILEDHYLETGQRPV